MAETLFVDDADAVLVAYGTPARYLRQVVFDLRAEGVKVGLVRPITLWPFPSDIVGSAVARAGVGLVYELNAGQMIDDVRLAVAGRADIRAIGGTSLDESGFGIAPDLNVETLTERVRSTIRGLEKEPAL
jgi:2-oxoglutarate/2-oxoacid ferredoxin oxidoreductase subunit alpha